MKGNRHRSARKSESSTPRIPSIFGVVCYDQDPNSITITEGRRDAPLGDTDSFQLILDTYWTGNGFLFATNPAGIEYDAQITGEGEGGGVQRWGNPRDEVAREGALTSIGMPPGK